MNSFNDDACGRGINPSKGLDADKADIIVFLNFLGFQNTLKLSNKEASKEGIIDEMETTEPVSNGLYMHLDYTKVSDLN